MFLFLFRDPLRPVVVLSTSTHPHPFDTNATPILLMQTQEHDHLAHSSAMNPAHPTHPTHPASSLGDELHDADDSSFDEPRGFRGRLGERLESKTTHRVVLSLVSRTRYGLESGECTCQGAPLLRDREESSATDCTCTCCACCTCRTCRTCCGPTNPGRVVVVTLIVLKPLQIAIDASFVLTSLAYCPSRPFMRRTMAPADLLTLLAVLRPPTCPPNDPHPHPIEETPDWLEVMESLSLAIMFVFLIEIPLDLYAFGPRYFGLSLKRRAVPRECGRTDHTAHTLHTAHTDHAPHPTLPSPCSSPHSCWLRSVSSL